MSRARKPIEGQRYYTRPLPGTVHLIYSIVDEFGYVLAEQISRPEGIEVPMPPGVKPLPWRSPAEQALGSTAMPISPELLLARNRPRTFVRAPKSANPQKVTP